MKTIFKKKYYLPAILLISAIIISVYYTFFRDNDIENNLHKSRYIFAERLRNIEIHRFPSRLQLDFQRLLTNFNTIQLSQEWHTEIDFDLTHQPFFDLRNLYLVSFDKIAVYDKSTLNNIWLKELSHDIVSFTLIDGNNILVIDTSGHIYALNRNTGEQIWSQTCDDQDAYNLYTAMKPLHITNNDDKRLLTSIVIVPLEKKLRVIDSITGELLYSLTFEDKIYRISDYDPIDNAIYVIYGNKIAKILLEKK